MPLLSNVQHLQEQFAKWVRTVLVSQKDLSHVLVLQ